MNNGRYMIKRNDLLPTLTTKKLIYKKDFEDAAVFANDKEVARRLGYHFPPLTDVFPAIRHQALEIKHHTSHGKKRNRRFRALSSRFG